MKTCLYPVGFVKEDKVYSIVSEAGGLKIADEAAGRTETTYQFRIFRPRCETYAFRLADSEINGVCGPLEYDEVLFSSLPDFSYTNQADTIAWVQANLCDFCPCDAEYEEGMVWI